MQKYTGFHMFYYLLYQLGTGGRTQKVKPVQGVYPKQCVTWNCFQNQVTNSYNFPLLPSNYTYS